MAGGVFAENSAVGFGGAISAQTAPNVEIRNVYFVENTSQSGGGAIASEDSIVQLFNITFSDNVDGDFGSDIYIADDNNPQTIGSFVYCDPEASGPPVIFCDGSIRETAIYETSAGDPPGTYLNTNCFDDGKDGSSLPECKAKTCVNWQTHKEGSKIVYELCPLYPV
jgi:predicted outer membrane repeat protein